MWDVWSSTARSEKVHRRQLFVAFVFSGADHRSQQSFSSGAKEWNLLTSNAEKRHTPTVNDGPQLGWDNVCIITSIFRINVQRFHVHTRP
ncbi:hypothetical protein T4D_1696 [Trichinella pseudospiralis]|uniref:Uncharacterized protein n=1 Tax=Trichinella pseudospiralis TaxID=6337 RepID=A0A0V1FJM8_TRIPS|nr:hypothetical protein T4D_1696 [Trichinella pseudospiralis]